MAGGMQGGDPADMERVAGIIDGQRQEIEGALKELQTKVHSLIPTIWNGPDAEKFVGDFDAEVKPQFDEVIREMTEAAAELRRNAKEQAQTSAN
ncbi:hypothetical protein USB125703_01179 [Pseudoclavibacter triregionum]|nr:hypothetical protein USB125703_01179 [Pseudoclavibacter triregionum]